MISLAWRLQADRVHVWTIKGEKRLVRTLLGVADHHELLTDVATAVHRDKKLSHIFFHRVDLLREEHCRLCLEESGESKRRESEGKKKRVIICITICKNPHYIRTSSADTGFCSGSALVSRSWHFFIWIYWSGGPAVCLFKFKNNSPSHFLSLKQPEVLFKGTPPEVFLTAWCVALNYTCKPLRANQLGVLHTGSSLQEGVHQTIPCISFPCSSPCPWEESLIEWWTENLWKRLSIKVKNLLQQQ